MGQEPATAPAEGQEPAATEPKEGQEPQGTEPKTFDKEYVSQLRAEAAKWRTEAQQRQEKLEEREEAEKSELEKAQGKLSKAEERAQAAEAALVRFEVARDKEVPAAAVDFLTGSTREELEASADRLLELVKNRPDTDTKPDFDGGAREPAPDPKAPEDQHNDAILKVLGLAPPN